MLYHFAFLFIFVALQVKGHSWMECSKYMGDVSKPFDPAQCEEKAKPRPIGNRNVRNGGVFGADIGFDYRPPTDGSKACQGDATNFAQNYPQGAVEYEVGGTYTLAWPPKNHVAACGNNFIPDEFLKLHMVPYTNGQADPNQSVFRANQVAATFSDDPHVRGMADYKGFQNCPNFCNNKDKALCTGNFTVPTATTPGTYTFQWYWAFNGPQDLYSTCYEAVIVAKGTGDGKGFRTTTLTPEAPVTPAPVTAAQPGGATAAPITVKSTGAGDLNFAETDSAMNNCAKLTSSNCKLHAECTWCPIKPRTVCGSTFSLSETCMWTPSSGKSTREDNCDEIANYKQAYKIEYSSQCPYMCNAPGDFGYMPCSGVLTLSLVGFLFLVIGLHL